MPSINDVFVDPALTNVSVKYSNDSFIADSVYPILEVAKKSGYYFVYDKKNLKTYDSNRTGMSEANVIDYELTKTAYGPLNEHSLASFIEDDEIDQSDSPLEPRVDHTEFVTEALAIEREKDLATDLANTALLTQNTTLSGTSQWSDYANSTPFTDIDTGHETIAKNAIKKANTAIMSLEVWNVLKNHPDLLDRIKWSQFGVLTEDLFAQLIGVTKVLIGEAVYNSAKEGQTASMAFIWGKHLILAYITPAPSIRTVSFGYHLTLRGKRYMDRWDDRVKKGEFVRINDYYKRVIVAVECAYLIKNAVA